MRRSRRALPVLAEAAAAVAGPGHRTVATLGGNLCLDTRCVFYNQSEWWRRANDFCLKHGGDICHVAPQGKRCHAAFSGDLAPALLVLGADGRDRRPGRRAAVAARGALRRRRRAASGARARRDRRRRAHSRRSRRARAPATARRARAARSIFRLPASPRASRCDDGASSALARRADRHQRAAVPARGHGRARRRSRSTTRRSRKLGKLVQKQVSPMRTTVTHSNYRRQVAAVLAQRLVRELAAEPAAGARGPSG